MPLKFNSITLLISSLITGGGAWLGYELSKPSTVKGWLEWRGLHLASETDENIWKALYFQAKEKLNPKDIKDSTELKNFCITAWNESVKASSKSKDVEEFCTKTLKSRKARMIAEGLDQTKPLGGETDNEDYKVSFVFNSHSAKFLELLGGKLTKDSKPEEALETYKNYCSVALKEDSSEYIKRTYQICKKQEGKKVSDLLKFLGYRSLNEKEIESEWNKAKKLKGGNTLLKDIDVKGEANQWKGLKESKEEFTEHLNKWCDNEKEKNLIADKYYVESFPSVKSRCARKEQS